MARNNEAASNRLEWLVRPVGPPTHNYREYGVKFRSGEAGVSIPRAYQWTAKHIA